MLCRLHSFQAKRTRALDNAKSEECFAPYGESQFITKTRRLPTKAYFCCHLPVAATYRGFDLALRR